MKSILSLIVAAIGLLEVTNAAAPILLSRALTYKGCFSSNGGATLANDTDIYNSRGQCQKVCIKLEKSVLLVSNAMECWCGNKFPAASTKVDDSSCNTPCAGYPLETCGGIGFFSAALDGLTNSAEEFGAPAKTVSSSTSSPTPTPTSATSPSVVTSPGETVIVTSQPEATSTLTPETKKSGPNVGAIAAGVVIGFLALACAGAGLFFFIRHKRRREIEEDHRRNAAVSSFVGSQKPPQSSSGSFSDTRLDPVVMAGRRVSNGSIADNQDYSRRILKVTNA